jgi:peptidyl-prolyl cis-trans isomerase D
MLQNIHDKLKGWLATIVLGAIALVFIFWGINWTMSAPTYAARVDGSDVSANDVRQAYQQQLAQVERQSQAPLDDAQRTEIKRRVLEDYVSSEAIVNRADKLGYRVSNADVLGAMAQVPAFQVDGKFDEAHAVAVLHAQGRSVPEIEELFRREVRLRQLDTALSASAFVTGTELKAIRDVTFQQRELAWLTLSAQKYAAGATPDEAALKGYYEAHKAEYMTPETVDLHYLEVSLAQLEAKVKVDDAQLKSYYDEQKQKSPERFTTTEQRRVRHILLAVNDPKEDAAVKAKADDLLKRVKVGEDFAKLAKEFSQDPGSAQQGGDLGWSERKTFVGPFADAAFAMQVNAIEGPVKTQFGYHILKLDGIQPPAVKPFEAAKAELETEYRRNEAERLYNAAQDSLADAALQNATDLDVVARKAGLTVQEIPNFSRSGGGGALGNVPAVNAAAFSQDVLDGRLSPIVEAEQGRGVVLKATDHKLPEQKPLEVVRTEVVAAWKLKRGAELARAAGDEAAKRLKAGESLEAVAKSLSLPVPAPKFISRSDQDVPLEVRTQAFLVPKPAPKPSYGDVTLANGDVGVFAVSGVREEPGEGKPPEAEIRTQLAQRFAVGEKQGYSAAVRAAAKVTLNPQAID